MTTLDLVCIGHTNAVAARYHYIYVEWVVISRTDFTESSNNDKGATDHALHNNNIDKDVNIVKSTHTLTLFIIVTPNEMPMSVPINIQSLKLFNYLLL